MRWTGAFHVDTCLYVIETTHEPVYRTAGIISRHNLAVKENAISS